MREIVRALAEPGFGEGTEDLPGWRGRGGASAVRRLATMTEYQHGWPYPVAFRSAHAADTLGAVVSRAGASQLHVAETEKYAHVTYFFNGGEEQVLPGERRALVPSQRDVPTYDLKPQMSGREVAAAFEQAFAARASPLHGDQLRQRRHGRAHGRDPGCRRRPWRRSTSASDGSSSAVHAAGGACAITADHGNAEQMLEPDGGPSTFHSLNPVPLIVTARGVGLRPEGSPGRRRADRARAAQDGAVTQDGRPLAARALTNSSLPSADPRSGHVSSSSSIRSSWLYASVAGIAG